MKLKLVLSVIAIFLISSSLFSQNKKVKTVVILTSAQCEMCKEKIEKELVYTNGVKSAVLNLDDKNLTVIYQTKKISEDELRNIISSLGYDADDVKANMDAYIDLPTCCKKPADRVGKPKME